MADVPQHGRHGVVAALCVTLMVAGLLGFPAQARAAEPPEGLESVVADVAREAARGPVAWARYVETSPAVAAQMLGKRPGQLSDGMPGRVYLVVMHGDLSDPGHERERGPYLAFVYWPAGDEWEASDFTLLQRPPPLQTAGVPHDVRPFAMAHPTLDRTFRHAWTGLVWLLAPALLAASAALCLRKRPSRRAYALSAAVAAATGVWQTAITILSMRGRPWDPTFHAVKLAVLALVLAVDVGAVYLLLRRRAAVPGLGEAHAGAPARSYAASLLLFTAAVLYVPTWFWLASTGE